MSDSINDILKKHYLPEIQKLLLAKPISLQTPEERKANREETLRWRNQLVIDRALAEEFSKELQSLLDRWPGITLTTYSDEWSEIEVTVGSSHEAYGYHINATTLRNRYF